MSSPPARLKVALGADHAGFHAKELIKSFLQEAGYDVDDVGTQSEESVDYPDYAKAVAERVAAGAARFGILTCGTGLGMAMTANKVPGVRAVTAHNQMTAHLAREHNDANVLALGARVLRDDETLNVVREFLKTEFAGGRHQRRVDKINELDKHHGVKTAG
jgi:ribose 5-phosphate isomerase B